MPTSPHTPHTVSRHTWLTPRLVLRFAVAVLAIGLLSQTAHPASATQDPAVIATATPAPTAIPTNQDEEPGTRTIVTTTYWPEAWVLHTGALPEMAGTPAAPPLALAATAAPVNVSVAFAPRPPATGNAALAARDTTSAGPLWLLAIATAGLVVAARRLIPTSIPG